MVAGIKNLGHGLLSALKGFLPAGFFPAHAYQQDNAKYKNKNKQNGRGRKHDRKPIIHIQKIRDPLNKTDSR